jgi:malate dehydrogenase (oxaloacetate-decarboxylating)(NADP+)
MSEQDDFKQAALDYHRLAPAGKIRVMPTKAMVTQRDLALAYSPGVAAACEAIVADPGEVSTLTARGNLVGVITNGTAVLGLGNIGPLAGKPVMEGKGVLFQKFAGIDVFDIEINENDPDKLVDIIASLEPTFGGINLEDIKAPECFVVERKLRERLKIPVFHDDQHGTAIIVGAALLNALHVVGKDIGEVKLAVSGAGAAGIACLDMLVALGVKPANIHVVDRDGVLHTGRPDLCAGGVNEGIARYARETASRALAEIVVGADVFVGVSAGGILKPEMLMTMADKPIIFALANPTPEIDPGLARATRPDAIIATGRSDYPNQVNNALCFPYIFRGALDVGATSINEEMKLACVRAIAELARREATDLGAAYAGETPSFGPDYLIPRPFDPRLLVSLAPAVAKAAMDSGVATRPLADIVAYRDHLISWVFRTGLLMKPVFDRARGDRKRVVYAEGEEETVLRAVQTVVDEGLAFPILVGRPAVIERRIAKLNLRLRIGVDVDVTNIDDDPRFNDYWQLYHEIMQRKGITPSAAKALVRSRDVVIAALMVRRGEADAMLCGLVGRFVRNLKYVREILGLESECKRVSALSAVLNDAGVLFFVDTHVNVEPTAAEIAESAIQAAFRLKLFGIAPKVALVSHSNFGSSESLSSRKMRDAVQILRERAPKLEVEGEMHADIALNEAARRHIFPNSKLTGRANLLVFANLDAANAGYNLVRTVSDGVGIGPILMGLAATAHVLTPSATVRRVVNMTAIAAVDAQIRAARG